MEKVAVLASGGLDSTILLADLAENATVFPIYVRAGLAWEEEEHKALKAFIAAVGGSNLQPITTLAVPMQEVYGEHWSVTGRGVPAAEEPDSAVFIPGRNVLLIGLTAVWCSTRGISRIAISSLEDNPFPDATPEFFQSFGRTLSQGLGYQLTVEAPYRHLHKYEIIRKGSHLPLELTMSCMTPKDGRHCGVCAKCRERRQAFQRANVTDRTTYAKL